MKIIFRKYRNLIIIIFVLLFLLINIRKNHDIQIVSTLPASIDLIFSFGGDSYFKREKKAMEIFLEHPEATWLLSTSTEFNYYLKFLDEQGIDTNKVHIIKGSNSTWEEVNLIFDYIKHNSKDTLNICLVSHKIHFPRIKTTIKRQYKKDISTLIFHFSSAESNIKKTSFKIKAIVYIQEKIKHAFYLFL